MYSFDAYLTRALNSIAGQHGTLDLLMVSASAWGVPILVLLVAAQWWRKQDRQHHRHILVATGLSFLLGLAINQLILLFAHRVRPYDAGISHLIVAPSADPSFPSDHATATAAIAAAFLVNGAKRMGLLSSAVALCVITSRVYIGTHYVSDVVGGALTGIAAALLVRTLYCEGTAIDRAITNIL
ncbi:MAG: phosphatase PAP2 family protein [Proteobacteria bacterium]|nr:phosphatase PAP2 family protein [Pseudomonadota bacterium]